jgi:UDP-N-acetylmuramoyl-tripeptide--D-alanyl-D-alanine ligase
MTEPLWTLPGLVEASGGRPLGPPPKPITGLSIDSRTIREGDAFLAIKGEHFDGHDFVRPALAHGAALAVVSQNRLVALGALKGPFVVVDDVTDALRALAIAARARSPAKVIAVTGSAGKTTAKDMLKLALAASGEVHAAAASYNNYWGVPLTLARMPASAAFGVFEIGMNHPGEIRPLTKLVRPHAAIVTTVDAVHLGAFANVEQIARAKGEIFEGFVNGGAAILNRDNPHFDLLAKLAREAGAERVIGFGRHPDADARLEDLELKAGGSAIRARIDGRPIVYELGAAGEHMAANSLAVLAAAAVAGADVDRAAESFAEFSAGKGRGRRILLKLPAGSAILVDESYNANPASMRAALGVLSRVEPREDGRRIAVLGDMLELGVNEAEMHAALAEPIAEAAVDCVHLVGPVMASLWEALPPARRGVYAQTVAELTPRIAGAIAPGDVIMVKGSNGIRLGDLVEELTKRFGVDAELAAGG